MAKNEPNLPQESTKMYPSRASNDQKFVLTQYMSQNQMRGGITQDIVAYIESHPFKSIDLSSVSCESFPLAGTESSTGDTCAKGARDENAMPLYENLEILIMTRNSMKHISSIGPFKNLIVLNLSNNLLTTLPKSISELKQLYSLDLSNNNFSVCPELGSLPLLSYLNISENKLTEIDLGIERSATDTSFTLKAHSNIIYQFPNSLLNIKSLIDLDLSDNSIKIIPPEIGELATLSYLNLSDNKISSISLKNLKSLQILKLNGNKLNFLPNDLCDLRNLRELEVSNNSLTSFPNNIGYSLKYMERIIASNNKLSKLAASLSSQSMPLLQVLDLQYNQLESLPIQFLSNKHSNKLTLLDISHNLFQWLEHSVLEYFSINNRAEFRYLDNRFADMSLKLSFERNRYLIIEIPTSETDYSKSCACATCGKSLETSVLSSYYVLIWNNTSFKFNIPAGYICCSRNCAEKGSEAIVNLRPQRKTDNSDSVHRKFHELSNDSSKEQLDMNINQNKSQALISKLTSTSQKYITDNQPENAQSSMPFPVSVEVGSSANKNLYYCEICEMKMNSQQTFDAHKIGKRHLKKVQERELRVTTTSGSHFYCDICNIQCTGAENYLEHTKGKMHHQKSLKLSLQTKANINEQVAHARIKPTPNPQFPIAPKNQMYKCDICNVECTGIESYRQHIESKSHTKAVLVNQSVKESDWRKGTPLPPGQFSLFSSNISMDKVIREGRVIAGDVEKSYMLSKIKSGANSNFAPFQESIYKNEVPQPLSFPISASVLGKSASLEHSSQEKTLYKPENFISTSGIPTSSLESFSRTDDKYYCKICDCRCTGEETYQQHIHGKKHEKKLTEMNANILTSPSTSSGSLFQTQSMQPQGKEIDYSRIIQIVDHLYEKLFKIKPVFIDESTGPPHKPTFTSYIDIPPTSTSKALTIAGHGTNKADARRDAARKVVDEFLKDGRAYALVPARLLFKN